MHSPSPNSVESELQLVFVAYRAGDLKSAEARADRLLHDHPQNGVVLMAKGIVSVGLGDLASGQNYLGRSVQIQPKNPEALSWAAYTSLKLERFEEAENFASQFAEIAPNDARAHYLLACALSGLNRIEEALRAVDRSLELRPDDGECLVLKARLLKRWRLPALAIEFYRRALAIGPSPAAAIDLAQILLRDSHPREALDLLKEVETLLPEHLRPYDLIARAHTELLEFDQAEGYWSLAESCYHDLSTVRQTRARAEIAVGRFGEAEAVLSVEIDCGRRTTSSFFLLTTARKMTKEDLPLVQRMVGSLAQGELSALQAAELNYALGKTFDDLKDYERAIGFYDEANRISSLQRAKGSDFTQEAARAYTDSLIDYFSPDRIADFQTRGLQSETPLLVVGMPRSGTTLTENILSAHSKIKAGGEQSFWPERSLEFLKWHAGKLELNQQLTLKFAEDYLQLLDPRDENTLRVIDKNPNNFTFAAMLHYLFPNAKIIHLKRNALDNALSIWMTPFSLDAVYLSDRKGVVFAYREHLKLLKHFMQVLPGGRFATFQYEELTSSPRPTIDSMFSFVGLAPEVACYEPEKNSRAVLTPSVYQVRQPINERSQARWKNYEPWLGDFAELLEESD